ncbi:hypothetical protein DYBT9623_04572 [Dyadobacter sp. CECT 9623]|uniref:Uncharacterized protein n=2 Tax=Dyadobacter linearis TaxID=2823330 RepID=A0ABN7RGA0_9BACT|nr:hypothetical protein DYBT9623_04572 [Dyadobacter sp. CECT 9623]
MRLWISFPSTLFILKKGYQLRERTSKKLILKQSIRCWYDFISNRVNTLTYQKMDIIIFFKAIGNLLFTAILFFAILVTSAFSVLTYLLKGMVPAMTNFKTLLLPRSEDRPRLLRLGKKILSQKKF